MASSTLETEHHASAQTQLDQLLASRGEFFIHPEGSPYLGLTIEEQRVLSKLRRGDGRTPKWRLNEMRKATKQDYEKLLLACTEALVAAWHDPSIRLDRVDVYVRLPHNYRAYWDKNLPRPVILGYDDWTVFTRFKVDKLIDWLHSRGYSYYTASELRKSIWAVLQEQKRFDLYYDLATQTSILELYAEVINDVKEKKVSRVLKGRGEYKKMLDIDTKA